MIDKSGKLFINGNLYKNRYDKNEDYGVIGQCVTWFEILKEYFFLGYKITISKRHKYQANIFTSLAFDPLDKGKHNGKKER